MTHIYTTTVFHADGAEHCRVWGWYETQEEAEKAVLRGWMFEEGHYLHALIEEIAPAFCMAEQVAWFVHIDGRTERCEPPDWVAHTVNFAMG